MMFYLAQVLGIIAWIFMLLSYYKKNTKKIIYVQLLGTICYLLNYVFLGAYAGTIIIIIELIRDYLYYKKTNNKFKVFLIFLPIYLIMGYITKNNWVELVPIIASFIEAYSLTHTRKEVVAIAVLVYILWIFYDIEVLSITGAITDVIVVISNIIVIVKYLLKVRKIGASRVYSHTLMSESILDSMHKLALDYYPKKVVWKKDYQKELYLKNKDTFSFIKYKNRLIGYINYLVISESVYEKIINSDKLIINYDKRSIVEFSKDSNYCIIDTIVIDEDYVSEKAVIKYVKTINKYFNRKINEGYKFNNIIGIGMTEFENNVLSKSKLKYQKKLEDGNILYSIKEV